jgi:hypothetical protein
MIDTMALRLGTHAFEALMEEAMRCPCDQEGMPLCVRCACLFSLAVAATDYAYARTGRRANPLPSPEGPRHA